VLTVMTWNVENLFLPGSPSGPKTEQVYRDKLSGLAAVINNTGPDAIGLQEVGDPVALDQLVALLDGDWQQRVSGLPDARGIRVAWLSRMPISADEQVHAYPPPLAPVQRDDHGATDATLGRGALAITVQTAAGDDVTLLTTHLKSKLLTFPGNRFNPTDENERARFAAYALYRRAAEAASLRVWATAALGDDGHNRRVVVCGDLNDTPQAATTQLLLGPPGSEIGTRGFNQPDKGDKQRLWNLAPKMPAGADYSRISHGRKELIDHILVSHALVQRVTDVRTIVEQPLPSVTTDPGERRSDPSSDHAAVIATFNP
jgi:endonuclease/exonuclease/phosphatase family metal-dependent hydrolase